MKLTTDEIAALPGQLPGWAVEGQSLVRQYVFESFPDAIGFVTRLAFDVEAADHHPDMHLSYRQVTVRWTTHSDDGLTDKDVAGARRSDAVAHMMGSRVGG